MLCLSTNCPICGTGNLGFRTCDDHRTIVIMCDECDAVWLDPAQTDASLALYPSKPPFIVPGTSVSIAQPKAHWSSRDEIVAAGWADWIVN